MLEAFGAAIDAVGDDGVFANLAERLCVHENTIRHRLARIAELTALDVATSVDDRLAGQLATLILRLEGALPAPSRVAALVG